MASEKVLMQDAGKLVQLFLKLHADKYGKRPTVNIFKEKYAMKDVIESVGYERAEELLRYYFKTGRQNHPLDWFKYNFEKLDAIVVELTEDQKKVAETRAETARRVAEWKKQNEGKAAAFAEMPGGTAKVENNESRD